MSNKADEPTANYSTPLNFEKVWLMFQEVAKQQKETRELFKERDAETDKRNKETDKRLKALNNLFTSQWGKLMESLVEGDLINILQARGVTVSETLQRIKGNTNGENYEFDIFATNGNEMVVVEVKTTLRASDVKDFESRLNKFKTWIPRYKNTKIYGAMAYLVADEHSNKMAQNKGFFTIRATSNSSSIVNSQDFKPRVF